MKHVQQVWIIFFISFIGEICKYIIPLPIPASIYGFVLMLLCLTTGMLPLSKVSVAGRFFIEIMPVMFIPAVVGLI